MIPVVGSSIISEIGYDSAIKELNVLFQSGSKYAYYDVSTKEYNEILYSKSSGSKLKEVVKEKEYKKI